LPKAALEEEGIIEVQIPGQQAEGVVRDKPGVGRGESASGRERALEGLDGRAVEGLLDEGVGHGPGLR
jgi:hypothetical protein